MFGDDLPLVSSTGHARMFAAPGLLVARCWGDLGVAEVDAAEVGLQRAREGSESFAVLMSFDGASIAPARAAREQLGAAIRRHGESLFAWAAVVAGTGLPATGKRTMMRLVMTLARIRCAWLVESDIVPAVDWLGDRVRDDLAQTADRVHWI